MVDGPVDFDVFGLKAPAITHATRDIHPLPVVNMMLYHLSDSRINIKVTDPVNRQFPLAASLRDGRQS